MLQPQGVVDDTDFWLAYFAILNADAFHIHITHHFADFVIAEENVATIAQIVTRIINGVWLIPFIPKIRNHLQRLTQRIRTHQFERRPAVILIIIVLGTNQRINKILVHIPFRLVKKGLPSQPTEGRPVHIHPPLTVIDMLAVAHPIIIPI